MHKQGPVCIYLELKEIYMVIPLKVPLIYIGSWTFWGYESSLKQQALKSPWGSAKGFKSIRVT